MNLLSADILKIKILLVLYESPTQLTYNRLNNKVGCINYYSLLKNIEFLIMLGMVENEIKYVENRKHVYLSLSENGCGIVNELKDKFEVIINENSA
ncbi:hypothetical protein [Methanococcus sp. CF]